jgi:hypothetical protein
MNGANVQNRHRTSEQRCERSVSRRQETKRDGDRSDQSWHSGNRQTYTSIEA